MTTKTITPPSYKVYSIEDHPNPEACFDYMRENWHDLGDHYTDDAVNSIKGFAQMLNLTPEWSICIHPDRGEEVTFTDNNHDDERLAAHVVNKSLLEGNCPFTGMVYDEVLLDAFREAEKGALLIDVLKDAGERILEAVHNDGEYIYSDDGLRDMCEGNEYFFTIDGDFHS